MHAAEVTRSLIYCCLIQNSLCWLQPVQNVAARIFTNSRRSDRITTVTYHSVSGLISKCYWSCSRLNQVGPQMTSCELVTSYEPNHSVALPRPRVVTTNDRAFVVKALPHWNAFAGLSLVCYFGVHFKVPASERHFLVHNLQRASIFRWWFFIIFYLLSV